MREKYFDKLGLHRNEQTMEIEGQDSPIQNNIIKSSFNSSENVSGVVSQQKIQTQLDKEADNNTNKY